MGMGAALLEEFPTIAWMLRIPCKLSIGTSANLIAATSSATDFQKLLAKQPAQFPDGAVAKIAWGVYQETTLAQSHLGEELPEELGKQ